MIKNNKGFITADYIFALVMVMGFTVVMFSFAIAFVGAEVTQYMTFAAARAYYPAHKDKESQRVLGEQKFESLLGRKAFKVLLNGNWFENVAGKVAVGSHEDGVKTIYTFSKGSDQTSFSFFGASVSFTPKILNFKVPMMGSTFEEGQEDYSQMHTTIGSFLGREPNQSDCRAHMSRRWAAIRNLKGGGNYKADNSEKDYVWMADNGC